jgi:glycosyltransferase involved in cell wall biosynthesis
MRKLLMLTYHFPPSAASGTFRLLGFARHLPRFGWRPLVVAPPHLPWEPVDPGLLQQLPAEVSVRPVPYPQGWSYKPVRRLAPHAVWLPRAARACARLLSEQRPDALFTSSPPHCVHVLGLWLKRRFRIPWVADFRDPWFIDGRPSFGHMRWSWFEARCERAVLRGADAVVTNAPRARDSLRAAHPACAAKIVTITNGYDPERFPAPSPGVASDGPLRVIHTGEVYAGRDPRPFLDALRDLGHDPGSGAAPFRVSFLGRTDGGGIDLGSEARQRGLEQVVDVGGQVSYADTLRDMARADILLLLDSPGRRMGVPAKLYEYLGAGRPVLALAEPDADVAWVLRTSGISHRIAPVRDAGRIRQALVELAGEVRAGRGAGSARGPLAAFTRQRLTQDLAELLDGCLWPAEPLKAPGAPVGLGLESPGQAS